MVRGSWAAGGEKGQSVQGLELPLIRIVFFFPSNPPAAHRQEDPALPHSEVIHVFIVESTPYSHLTLVTSRDCRNPD